ITKEGVDWLLRQAGDVRRFANHVTDDVLGGVNEDAAIAIEQISEGDEVTLEMKDGLLHARPGAKGPATGVATTSASAGHDVGVTGFEGIIDLDPGTVTVIQVPSVRSGGSRAVNVDQLTAMCEDAPLVCAAGVEAVVALDRVNIEPRITFAAGNVAASAASRGLDVVVVASTDAVGRVTDPLRDAGISYTVNGNV
ncbi:MAG: Crp/Fnr family transcriptional regulator, partial [Halobacteriaceae archaeon]